MEICEYHRLSVSPECGLFIVCRYFWKCRTTTSNLVTVPKEVFSKGFPSWLRYFCKMSKQSIPLSKSGNMFLNKNFSWNVMFCKFLHLYYWRVRLSMKVHHHLNQYRERWCHNHMWCLDSWSVDSVLRGNLSVSCSIAPQPIPGIRRLGQQQRQYSAYSFKIFKTLKNNLISSMKKTKGTFEVYLYKFYVCTS